MGYIPKKYGTEILDKFGLQESALLGQGCHSRVFGLDVNTALRIYTPGTTLQYVERVAKFFDSIDSSQAEFDIPRIIDVSHQGELFFTLEKRLGDTLEQAVSYLSVEEKKTALENFLLRTQDINTLKLPDIDFYGQVIDEDPIQRSNWGDYLVASVDRSLEISGESLIRDIPDFENFLSTWQQEVRSIPNPEKDLVHGDYYTGNVFIDPQSLEINAVIDFSQYTFIGDWRVDAVCAHLLLHFGSFPHERDRLLQLTEHKLGIDPRIINLYTAFIALRYSWRVFEDPIRKYQNWVVPVVKDAAARLPALV